MKQMKIEDFSKELERLTKEIIAGAEQGINEVAEDLLSTSQKLAPLDEGGLMESGTVEPAVNNGGNIKAVVGYNKVYALKMHEGLYNLGATSARKPSIDGMQVGRKFLAQPLQVYSDKYVQHIMESMINHD